MAKKISFIDRTRIERMVWSLDQQLYDLPRRTRVAHRRELRGNLIAAAQDMGTSAALRDLGDASALADEYLKAELGAGPRTLVVRRGSFPGDCHVSSQFDPLRRGSSVRRWDPCRQPRRGRNI